MDKKNPLKDVERRDFLKILSLTGFGSLIYSKDMIASVVSPNALSTVMIISNENATSNQIINSSVVNSMVDQGITTYTGISDVGEAWKSIFPGITASKVIGVKVNTLFNTKNNGTHPQVANSVTNGLVQMDFDGVKFPENNIIIFDFHDNFLAVQGYKLNTSSSGIRCFPSGSYSTETYNVAGINIKLSTIITQQIDYMVNIAYLKHHFLSGVSLCMKNHYGSINNPSASPLFHDETKFGDPYIPAITALDPIKAKQKFCIIDALYGLTNFGPSGVVNINPNKIIMGQDVVAVDSTGRTMLSSLGLSSNDLKKTTHIDTAATKYSLGNNEAKNINTQNITNTEVSIRKTENSGRVTELMQNSPNPFIDKTDIHFYLGQAEYVQLRVIDYSGKIINQLISKRLSAGDHTITWDGLDSSKSKTKAGIFLVELKTKSYNKSIIMQKIS